MEDINDILSLDRSIIDRISSLKEKSVTVPSWSVLLQDYEPKFHHILTDKQRLEDKIRSDGVKEPSARITVGLEKLISKRITEFTFSIPVKRVYSNIDGNETRQQIAAAIEKIYKYAHIDSENIKRGLAYYASCEIFTLWYVVEKPNDLYGFPSMYKLKCKTFSPMDGVKLYPLLDELGDMIGMSYEYKRKVKDTEYTFFETFSENKHFKWKNDGNEGGWVDETPEGGEDIIILKIPGVYNWRPRPVYDGLSVLREEIEYGLSRESNILAYNASPILAVTGALQGNEKKGETKRVWQLSNGGKIEYVSWNQAIDALKYQVDTLLKLFFMQSQMPDISFENMKALGNIGYDARMTMLMDAHLRIGDESGPWLEFFERENNVVKAFLKVMNVKWAKEVDNVDIENVITPFIQNDKKGLIETLTAGNGGKAVMSQLDSIKAFGESDDPEETLKQIQQEEASSTATRMNNVFDEGAE